MHMRVAMVPGPSLPARLDRMPRGGPFDRRRMPRGGPVDRRRMPRRGPFDRGRLPRSGL